MLPKAIFIDDKPINFAPEFIRLVEELAHNPAAVFNHCLVQQQVRCGKITQQILQNIPSLNIILNSQAPQAFAQNLQTHNPKNSKHGRDKQSDKQADADKDSMLLHWLAIDKFEKQLQSFQKNAAHVNDTTLVSQFLQWHPLTLQIPQVGEVRIDFLAGKKAHRRQFGGGIKQPLARAMGKINDQLPSILDATAGLGGDSFVLANLGFTVTMLERDPLVSLLLEDAVHRAQLPSNFVEPELMQTFARLSFKTVDSIQFLNQLTNQDVTGRSEIAQTIYLDPMYPDKKKNAATKKEMSALQHTVGPDTDSDQLLAAAIQAATYRVVVKRPKNAPPLFHKDYLPTTQIKSPNTRYDIYVIKALNKR